MKKLFVKVFLCLFFAGLVISCGEKPEASRQENPKKIQKVRDFKIEITGITISDPTMPDVKKK